MGPSEIRNRSPHCCQAVLLARRSQIVNMCTGSTLLPPCRLECPIPQYKLTCEVTIRACRCPAPRDPLSGSSRHLDACRRRHRANPLLKRIWFVRATRPRAISRLVAHAATPEFGCLYSMASSTLLTPAFWSTTTALPSLAASIVDERAFPDRRLRTPSSDHPWKPGRASRSRVTSES